MGNPFPLKKTAFAAGLCFASVALSTARGEDLRGHLLSRIEQRSLAVRSYKASFDLWIRAGGEEFELTGVTLFKWPKMLRVEMSLRDEKALSQILYWREGIVWQYLPSANVAFHREEETLRKKYPETFASQDLVNLQNPFDLVEGASIKFLGEESVEGESLYLFEGTPKKAIQHQGVLQPVLCRMQIADKDGLLRALLLYDASGREIVKQRFWDLQTNLELLDEEFMFKPENVKLVEVTKQTEKKMKLLLQEVGSP